jgi:uncharacterized membrane protein (UPF0127 family)
MTPLSICLTVVLALSQPGCDKGSDAPSKLPTVSMQVGSKSFRLEVADNDGDRQTGLMRRDSMPADHGMLFVFNREAPLAFWMSNTRIPLDIIYLKADGTVDSVKQMQPHNVNTVPSDGAAQYAIELNQGQAGAAGVKAGMKLKLPAGLKAKD